MPSILNNYPTLGSAQRHRWYNKVLTLLENCGCLTYWKDYTDLAMRGKSIDTDRIRLIWCLKQQCWSADDIDVTCLTEADKAHVFPGIVMRGLSDKLKAVRELKRSVARDSGNARRRFEERYGTCGHSRRKHLDCALEATKFLVESHGKDRLDQTKIEIDGLIKNSNWQKLVDTSRVLNLTTNELSNNELEVLSLGLNFKLQGTNNSIIGTFEGFERFDYQYKGQVGKPNLTLVKKETLVALNADKDEILPQRYTEAINSIKANKRVKILLSDKGKRTVACYSRTYDALLNSHYSDITHYQPVGNDDISGRDLTEMTNEFIDKLNNLARESNDPNAKNIIKGLMPPTVPRFPRGRVNLKVHKDGVTHDHIPVRPIVSNTDSPTSNLASYLGQHLRGESFDIIPGPLEIIILGVKKNPDRFR